MSVNFYVIVLLAFVSPLVQITTSYSTVTLIPALCGSTTAAGPGQLVRSHGQLNNDSVYENYTEPVTSCRYVMTAATSDEQLSFGFGTGYSERNAITNDMGCAGANISLYDSDGTVILNAVCGSLPSTLYTSKGNNLTLEVNSAGGNGTEISFNAHFTSFFIGTDNCSESDGKFACTNGRCVDNGGKCDADVINNCGDFSDQSIGEPANCQVTTTAPLTTTTTLAPEVVPADTSWLPLAVLGGLLAGLFLLWKLCRYKYLVWPCCDTQFCHYGYRSNFCKKIRKPFSKCCRCCNKGAGGRKSNYRGGGDGFNKNKSYNYQNGKDNYQNGNNKYQNGKNNYQNGKNKYGNEKNNYQNGKKKYENGKNKHRNWKNKNGKNAYDTSKMDYDKGSNKKYKSRNNPIIVEPGSNFSPYGPNKNLGNKKQYIDGANINEMNTPFNNKVSGTSINGARERFSGSGVHLMPPIREGIMREPHIGNFENYGPGSMNGFGMYGKNGPFTELPSDLGKLQRNEKHIFSVN